MSSQPQESIEPLSEASWARIEQRVFARLASAPPSQDVRRSWLRLGLVAAGLLLMAAGIAGGRVRWAPERYSTGRDEQTIALRGAVVLLEPGSQLRVEQRAGAASRCELERGAARFEVAPRRGREPFVVRAGEVRVEVVGTAFRVARIGERAQVETYEGKVRVSAGAQSALLGRGERWPLPLGVTAGVPAAVAAGASAAPALAAGAGEAAAPPARASEALAPPGGASEAAAPPALARAPEPVARALAEHAPRGRAAAAELDARQRARFELAARLERGDVPRALQLYRALAAQSGAWAANALFALGRLELARGARADAERDLRLYLARHPHGDNAPDARALLERASAEPVR